METVTSLLRNEGVRALWKGNVPAELLYILYGALQFTSYSLLNRSLCDLQDTWNFSLPLLVHLFVIGCGSGLLSTLMTYPFDLLRTRLVALQGKDFLSMTSVCREIYFKSGFTGFFAGILPSLVLIVANLGVFFWSYSLARTAAAEINKKHKVWGVEAMCGFMAGATAKAVTFPLDTLRKRMQVAPGIGAGTTLVKHFRDHGVRGFYRGFGISVLKTAPTSALLISIYEFVIRTTRVIRMGHEEL